jgi:hypothetical protein
MPSVSFPSKSGMNDQLSSSVPERRTPPGRNPGESGEAALAGLERRLDAIEADLVGLRLPLRFREYAYTLRVHLDLVRRRIATRRSEKSRTSRP